MHPCPSVVPPALSYDPAFDIALDEVETNMVFLSTDRTGMTAADLKRRMAQMGVLMYDTAPNRVRLVTHLDVSREQILAAIEAFKTVLMSV